MSIEEFPTRAQEPWHFPYHEGNRVVIEGRLIPRLTASDLGNEVTLTVDGRFSIDVPKDYGERVAWLVAQALAIGAGYSHLGALTKEQPFALVCTPFGAFHEEAQP